MKKYPIAAAASAEPAKALPYEPTSAMLIAARECDPALPIETIRALWWAMWRTAPAAPAPGVPNCETLRHSANEWADMATNGLQWIRNTVDGISDPKDALANMEGNLAHCRAVNGAPEVQAAIRAAAGVTAGAVPDVVREALEAAQAGLEWFRERCPDAVDGSDDEADALISSALAALAAAPQPAAAQEPVAWLDDGITRNGSDSTEYRVVLNSTKIRMPAAAAVAYVTPLYAHPAPQQAAPAKYEVRVKNRNGSWTPFVPLGGGLVHPEVEVRNAR